MRRPPGRFEIVFALKIFKFITVKSAPEDGRKREESICTNFVPWANELNQCRIGVSFSLPPTRFVSFCRLIKRRAWEWGYKFCATDSFVIEITSREKKTNNNKKLSMSRKTKGVDEKKLHARVHVKKSTRLIPRHLIIIRYGGTFV